MNQDRRNFSPTFIHLLHYVKKIPAAISAKVAQKQKHAHNQIELTTFPFVQKIIESNLTRLHVTRYFFFLLFWIKHELRLTGKTDVVPFKNKKIGCIY